MVLGGDLLPAVCSQAAEQKPAFRSLARTAANQTECQTEFTAGKVSFFGPEPPL